MGARHIEEISVDPASAAPTTGDGESRLDHYGLLSNRPARSRRNARRGDGLSRRFWGRCAPASPSLSLTREAVVPIRKVGSACELERGDTCPHARAIVKPWNADRS